MSFGLDFFCRVHERVHNAETRDGASFIALFGPALYLGIISRRRVHYEAIMYEKERNAGFLSPFGYSASTIAAAIDAVCSMEVLVFTVYYISDTHCILWDLSFKDASYIARTIFFSCAKHLYLSQFCLYGFLFYLYLYLLFVAVVLAHGSKKSYKLR